MLTIQLYICCPLLVELICPGDDEDLLPRHRIFHQHLPTAGISPVNVVCSSSCPTTVLSTALRVILLHFAQQDGLRRGPGYLLEPRVIVDVEHIWVNGLGSVCGVEAGALDWHALPGSDLGRLDALRPQVGPFLRVR